MKCMYDDDGYVNDYVKTVKSEITVAMHITFGNL